MKPDEDQEEMLVVGSIVAKAAGKYLDGEIDGSGFISEIGQDGLSMISGMLASKAAVSLLGGATGLAPMAVPVLAAMVASAACSEIYSRAQKVLQEHRDNLEIQQIADSASMEIAQQKIELKRLMGESHAIMTHIQTASGRWIHIILTPLLVIRQNASHLLSSMKPVEFHPPSLLF